MALHPAVGAVEPQAEGHDVVPFKGPAMRPDTVHLALPHPVELLRVVREVPCRGSGAPNGRRVLATCPSRSFRISQDPSGTGVALSWS